MIDLHLYNDCKEKSQSIECTINYTPDKVEDFPNGSFLSGIDLSDSIAFGATKLEALENFEVMVDWYEKEIAQVIKDTRNKIAEHKRINS